MDALFPPPVDGQPRVIDILLLPQFSLLSLSATMEPLRAANRAGAQTHYRWRLLSTDGDVVPSTSQVPFPVHGRFDPEDDRDALIVVSAFNVYRYSRPILPGLRQVARKGVPLGGVEAGSWALAMAGLLDGYRATTHWEDLDEFANEFPHVDVVPDRYVIDRKRFTTGGATPALDMMLEIIRADHGMALALSVAGIFIYEQDQPSTDPQHIVSAGRLALAAPQLVRAIRLMEETLAEPLPIQEIARHAGYSLRNLQLYFQNHLGSTPQAYYLELRLNAARRQLQQTRHSVAEIAEACGFNSASAFARAYRRRFGEAPLATRRSY